jgi:hypothetical protein
MASAHGQSGRPFFLPLGSDLDKKNMSCVLCHDWIAPLFPSLLVFFRFSIGSGKRNQLGSGLINLEGNMDASNNRFEQGLIAPDFEDR